jgi:hypothetical protein
MTETNQKQLGNTLWKIADDLRGAMNADDFRDPRWLFDARTNRYMRESRREFCL